MLRPQQNVVFLDDLALERGARDAQLLGRGADDRTGLQQNDPVVLRGVVRVNRNQMAWHFSSEDAHGAILGDPRPASCDRPRA